MTEINDKELREKWKDTVIKDFKQYDKGYRISGGSYESNKYESMCVVAEAQAKITWNKALALLQQRQKPLPDKKFIEKLAKQLYYWDEPNWEFASKYWATVMTDEEKKPYYQKANKLRALHQPKIEEARRQERERIFNELENRYPELKSLKNWQALKRGRVSE